MGESAKQQTDDPSSIEGLESLFDSSEPGSVKTTEPEEPRSEPVDAESVEVVSTDEAARRLGISSRAVIKRLKSGTLVGFRDDSKQRAEWRIYWKEPGSEPKGTSSPSGTEPQYQERTSSFNGTRPDSNGTGTSAYLVDLNQKLLEQVQILTYKNGYLESQLSEREKDISERDQKMKLLTDNQKVGLWSQFCAWFLGQKTGR